MQSNLFSTIAQSELFSGCTADCHRLIADRLHFHQYDPGTTILKAGHTDRALWVVLSGECKVVGHTQDAGEIELAQLTASSIFGELSFFAPAAHRVSVVAETEVHVAQFDRTDFDNLAQEHASIAHRLTSNAAMILARRLHRMDELICRTVAEARIAHHSEWQEFCELMHTTPDKK